MKKVSTVFMATVMLALSAGASVSPSFPTVKRSALFTAMPVERAFPGNVTPMPLSAQPPAINLTVPPVDLLSLTPKQFEEATGQKLNFFQKIKFKIAQKIMGKRTAGDGSKNKTTAALLAFFLGGLGVHRFYLGYTWQGVVQLLTFGGLGIWAFIDFVRILTGSLQPKDGSYE